MRVEDLFPSDNAKTLYVNRPLINTTAFVAWAKEQGFKSCLEPDQLHVTIAYSKEKVDWHDTSPMVDTLRVKGGRRSLEKLGDAIVLHFHSDDLHDRWANLIDIGCSWDYPTYKQHVTVTYKGQGIDFRKMTPYQGDLVFGPENFQPVSTNYIRSVKEINLKESLFRPLCRMMLRILAG